MDKRVKREKIYFFIVILAILASVLRCFFSIDVDEKYTTLCSVRIAQGYTMFGDMWENHQTSAIFAAPFLKLWYWLNGNLDGVVLFDRFITTIFTLINSIVVFCAIKKLYSLQAGAWCALVTFCILPRGTLSAEYGLLQANFVLLTICGMTYLVKDELKYGKRTAICILTGVSWSMAVLCYPGFVFCTIFLLTGLWVKKENAKRDCLCIIFTCGGCAVLFLLYIFSRVSFGEFVESLSAVTKHGTLMRVSYYQQLPEIVVKLCICALVALLYIFIVELICYGTKNRWLEHSERVIAFLSSPFASYSIILLFGNITKVYVTGCYGVAIAFCFIQIIAILGTIFVRDKYFKWLNVLGITIYIATLVQGDLGPKDYFNFLYVSVITTLLEIDDFSRHKELLEKRIFTLAETIILFFIILLIYVKGCCVRIDGVGYSTIFEDRVMCTQGPLTGIFLYPEDVIKEEEKIREITEYTKAHDNILVVSIDNLECTYSNGKYIHVTYCGLNMSILEKKAWIDYLESPFHDKVTKIFLDKDYIDSPRQFYETGLGQYITGKMEIVSLDELKRYYMIEVN